MNFNFKEFLLEEELEDITMKDILDIINKKLRMWKKDSSGDSLTFNHADSGKIITFYCTPILRHKWKDTIERIIGEYFQKFGCQLIPAPTSKHSIGRTDVKYNSIKKGKEIVVCSFEYAYPIGTYKQRGATFELECAANLNNDIVKYAKQYGCKLNSDEPYIPILDSKNQIWLVKHFRKIEKTPKADICGVDVSGNDCIFISLKDGQKADDFQQYSGISDRSSTKISNSNSTEEFVNSVKKYLNKKNKKNIKSDTVVYNISGQMYNTDIPVTPDVAKDAVYGSDSNSGKKGINNVDFLIQGLANIKPTSKQLFDTEVPIFQISGPHIYFFPNLPDKEYTPTYGVSKRSNMITKGIKYARFGIYSKKFAEKGVNLAKK